MPSRPLPPKKPAPARPPRHERSAGVILYRDEPRRGRLFLLLNYGRHWDYPKGHIEKGEDELAAARRELAEETGIADVTFVPGFREEIEYFFRHPRKGLVRKTVAFFLAGTTGQDVTLSDEHVGYAWEDEEGAARRLTYPTARRVFASAAAYLRAHPPS